MEIFSDFSICDYAHSAYWILFLLLMLSGLFVPISEEIILITGGAVAGMCIPEHRLHLYAWLYAGSWLSAWEVYWLGRLFGPKLYEVRWFKRFLNPQHIEKLHHYYEKYGIFTFIVGRFLPGGIRNTLFATCGLGKMDFPKFIMRDGIACILSSGTYFYIGYALGENYESLIKMFAAYNRIAFGIFLGIVLLLVAISLFRKKENLNLL